MAIYHDIIESLLARRDRINVTFRFRGGAKLDFVMHELQYARQFDVVIVDLSSGITLTQFEAAYRNIEHLARRARIQSVIITSIWPRSDCYFNMQARRHSQFFTNVLHHHNLLTFWQWDRRQSYRTYDGVHLEQNGYKKAARYLLGPVLWAVKNAADVGGIP